MKTKKEWWNKKGFRHWLGKPFGATSVVFGGCSMKGNGCSHGPQTWPWWRLFGLNLCHIDMHLLSTGWRLWCYTKGWAGYVEVFFNRRDLPSKVANG